jgi:hypothetical protein
LKAQVATQCSLSLCLERAGKVIMNVDVLRQGSYEHTDEEEEVVCCVGGMDEFALERREKPVSEPEEGPEQEEAAPKLQVEKAENPLRDFE